MKFSRQLGAALVLGAFSLFAAAQTPPSRNAQERPSVTGPRHRAGDWLRRFKDVPPDQQKKALDSDPQFKQLPPDRQERLKKRLDQFNNMSPDEKQKVLDRMAAFQKLTPEEKEAVRQLHQQTHELSDDRRVMVRKAFHLLKDQSADDRQKTMNSDHFKNTFNEQERGIITRMLQIQDEAKKDGTTVPDEPDPPQD
jgi:hypothetical protein